MSEAIAGRNTNGKYSNAKLKKILAKINAIPREKLDFSTS
jgi:IS30 family transposase